MNKSDLVSQLKSDAAVNGITIDGDYIIFDKKSKLAYKVTPNFTLKELLTGNPVSKTKLNLNLLVSLENIRETLGFPITIRASYHSPEYSMLSFGSLDSDLYTKGDALSLGVPAEHLEGLITAVQNDAKLGEIGLYKWGVHIGWSKGERKEWDKRGDTSHKQIFKDIFSNDKMKNILLIGAAAVAGWFFFLRKK
jgi:hypothetical protein